MYKTKLVGDPETVTFGFMELFDLTQPGGPVGWSKSSNRGAFPGLLNKSWDFGGLA